MGQSVESLTLEQRVAYYRQMAADALRLAETTKASDLRASYIGLASDWKSLADSVEHMESSTVCFGGIYEKESASAKPET